jgi:hypothetical protein
VEQSQIQIGVISEGICSTVASQWEERAGQSGSDIVMRVRVGRSERLLQIGGDYFARIVDSIAKGSRRHSQANNRRKE